MAGALARLRKLTANRFENLVYDLVVVRGLRNCTWRTPGADGGRDIEGHAETTDFAGNITLEKWYVECKRYSSSIDWPTIFPKISYASNHSADYLLVATTSSVSPRCKDEIQIHNAGRKRPYIRYWDGPALATLLEQYPGLEYKYRLRSLGAQAYKSLLPLVFIIAETIQAGYGLQVTAVPSSASMALELAASLVDVLTSAIGHIDSGHRAAKPFVRERDGYSWAIISRSAPVEAFDAAALRGVLCSVRFFTRSDLIKITSMRESRALMITPPPANTNASQRLMREISLLGDFEFSFHRTGLQLRAR